MVVILFGATAYTWVTFIGPIQAAAVKFGPENAAIDYALQDNDRISQPVPRDLTAISAPQSGHNLYWGELHIHTSESFDAALFGNTVGVEDTYRFAKGEPIIGVGGESMQLSRPLDFVAITDHAEGFGTRTHCGDEGLTLGERAACWLANEPNPRIFQILTSRIRGEAEPGDPSLPPGVYQKKQYNSPKPGSFPSCRFGDGALERCLENAGNDWARYVTAADAFYEPGVLTTLVAYEYSPGLPDQGKHHRNVIFRSSEVPDKVPSSIDVPSAIELWRELEANCQGSCDFLTIPHNSNKAWGLTYSRYTWDGKDYTEADWRTRQRREPLVEIFQIKGAQECALGVGATDEECQFEQVFEPCEAGQTTGCAFQTGFVRQGLKVGLELEREYGFNPIQSGFIAATDSHNSNPGDVEEWDFPGASGSVSSSAFRRLRDEATEPFKSRLRFNSSGGLAAVWAPENTREAIFDALARRETYATSGPRMTVQFYADWPGQSEHEAIGEAASTMQALKRTPMGGVVPASQFKDKQQAPSFSVWAMQDPLDAPLQRVQMVKGWIDDSGETHEKVVDIACANDLPVDPSIGRCADNGAGVDLTTCAFDEGGGAAQLSVTWQDPDFNSDQSAFYYVRVLMNPTCRWSTYDAIRLGRDPDPRVPATIRERAWTSPIWISQAVSNSGV